MRSVFLLVGLPRRVTMALACSTAFAAPAAAQWYVAGVPEPAKVIAAYGGPDSLDRMAHQLAALSLVGKFLETLSLERALSAMAPGHMDQDWTPEEARLMGTYDSAQRWVHKPEFDMATQVGQASAVQWFELVFKYERDTLFRNEVLHRFFSPEWVSGYGEAKRRSDDRMASVAAARRRIPAFHGAPVPDDERRFAIAVYGMANDPWCRTEPSAQANPIATELAERNFFRHLNQIVQEASPVKDWTGVMQEISLETPVLGPADAVVTVSIDTVSSYRARPRVGNIFGSAIAKVHLSPTSPVYTAASQLRVGQRVSFSGRMLRAESFYVISSTENSARRCQYAIIQTELTALRPAQ